MIGDIGMAIICLTVVIKVILYPFSLQTIKAQKSMASLQPKIEELKKRYKDQKEKMVKEMMEFYKKEKINPFSSCLPLLIQFPFLIAVFQVFRTGLNNGSLDLLYPFVKNPGVLNSVSFGIINLASPVWSLAILAGLAQWFQTKMMVAKQPPKEVRGKDGAKDETVTAIMSKQMMYMMPAMTVFIGLTLPGGLTLYWLITTLLTIVQQKIYKPHNKILSTKS
jgi:YidC/Oxa1 family membrane protein insertase